LGKNVTTRDVREGIVQGIESSYNVRLVEGTLSKSELSTAKELYDTKYSKSAWNLEK
jgi:lipoate-protein ligase A